jgi:hypothetical protein
MNTRKALPITTVLLILALALATVGVGYGLWSKTLFISGIVETGKLDVTLSLDEVDEGNLVLPANGSNPGFWEEDNDCDEDSADSDDCEVEGKEIAECTAVLLDEEGIEIGSIPPGATVFGGQTIEITIENGYPSFNCWVQFNVRNDGSIPVRVFKPVISNPNPTQVTVDLVSGFHGPTLGDDSSCYHDNSYNAVGEYPQVDEDQLVNCVIHAHVNQAAAQDRTGNNAYTFAATVCAHQWNEEATSGECLFYAP